MMMGLTPERRKELRELARQHKEKPVSYTHLDVYKRQAFLGLEHRYHTLMQVFRQHNEDYEKQVEARCV